MNHHYSKRSKPNSNIKTSDETDHAPPKDKLNLVAEELVALARSRLPANVLRGVLTGREDDIRQEAILLAYHWYLRQDMIPGSNSEHPWHAPRAIAAALQIKKKDALKTITREELALQACGVAFPPVATHPTWSQPNAWNYSVMQSLIHTAIKQALRSGRISHANAGVAMRVFVDQIPVKKLADQLKVHRSNIYQHLKRVRCVLPDIMDAIEVPYSELF